MAHYKTLLDPTDFIGPQDCMVDKTVTISRIVREKMPDRKGEDPTASPMMYFSHKGTELKRKLKVPKSVMHGLSLMLGVETDDWIGKEITLFAAHCLSFGDVEECVRVRFPPEIDGAIKKWLKKRKTNPGVYIVSERSA